MLQAAVEHEYKCLVSSKQYQSLLAIYRERVFSQQQINHYYCDDKQQIIKTKAILRLRQLPRSSILCFKIIQDNQLWEYEKENARLDDPEFLALLAKHDIYPPFKESGTLITLRRLVDLPLAFLCLDENYYGDNIDYEIEYELKSQHDGLTAFVAILKEADIIYQPNPYSKYQRMLNSKKLILNSSF